MFQMLLRRFLRALKCVQEILRGFLMVFEEVPWVRGDLSSHENIPGDIERFPVILKEFPGVR